MNKIFTTVVLIVLSLSVNAQSNPGKIIEAQPFGKIDKADLELTACDFEKDANAEVLFDVGNFYPDGNYATIMERHTRIKVFNDFGKSAGNVRLEYFSYLRSSVINNLQAQTINIENGQVVITKLDAKNAFTEVTDKFHSALVFAMPNVKAGSIIEYKYRVALAGGYFPIWYFQSPIPTRYSEIKSDFKGGSAFSVIPFVKQSYAKIEGSITDYTQTRALANVHSLPKENYIRSFSENLQRIEYIQLANNSFDTWEKIGALCLRAPDFGVQIDSSVPGESEILKHAAALKSNDEKIAFIYDTVKRAMKWNDLSVFYTIDGTTRAWNRKIGNSAEINMILCHLLKKAGIIAWPMIVSTKKNGRLNPSNPSIYVLNSTVVLIPGDSTHQYVLDATNKYNLYNQVPIDNLNTFGFYLNEADHDYQTVFLHNDKPAMQSIFVNAEIKPEGKMSGSAEITSYSYNKIDALADYKASGEKTYIRHLANNDNNLKIASLKLEDMEVDTLPLTQKIDFENELSGADGGYIYFNPNLFNLMGENPFKNQERYADIDFGYHANYAINGVYKTPAGYKIEALPKSITIVMPDESISFKRTVVEDDGTILVKLVLSHKKNLYYLQDYEDLRDFYKKMYEMLNEQIVLKKT